MHKKTVCFVAGKSGGHIIPCLTMAHEYKKRNSLNILFFSANSALDKRILAHNSLVDCHIMLLLSHVSASPVMRYPLALWQALISFIISIFYLIKHKPEKVISTGGIVSIPVCFAAFILRIPITLHELNATPGKTIKLLAPLATSLHICFEKTKNFFTKKQCLLTPYPIKQSLRNNNTSRQTACEMLNLDPHKKTLLILGGSQGSLFLNRCAQEWLQQTDLTPDQFQIIHQTGFQDKNNWEKMYQSHNITAHVFDYYDNLAHMYTAADSVLCRAGAGTLFELLFFKKSCLIIPLKTDATSHQIDNACAIRDGYPHLFHVLLQDECEKNMHLLFAHIDSSLMNCTLSKNGALKTQSYS